MRRSPAATASDRGGSPRPQTQPSAASSSSTTTAGSTAMEEFEPGQLVWFDPGLGYSLPGEVTEFSKPAQVVTVQAVVSGKAQSFTIHKLSSVRKRQDLGTDGVEDMVRLADLSEAALLWNLKIRYDKEKIYTYTGSILVAVNPYKMFDVYGVDVVNKYQGQILGTLPPHLFAISSAAYSKMSKDSEDQVIVISGESGAGKTESTKLALQYLAAVNRSPSNLVTEQILEASPLLEAFGNAKTVRNDNSSRFGKYLRLFFRDGVITGANTTDYLLEKSRIVTQAPEERNYHVFYELLAGLSDKDKEKYGLQTAEKYFYLNQGGAVEMACKDDAEDFRSLLSAMQVLGMSSEEQDAIFRILAAVLHLGNVYFHRKPLKHGQEGVQVGSEAEVRWASHLLQLAEEGILSALTTKTTEARGERLTTALNIDQALDARDAVAKALYSGLFSWLVWRVNQAVCQRETTRTTAIAILDIFGFEDLKENSLEQLCINYANEALQQFQIRQVFKLEQAEYSRERLSWQPLSHADNQGALQLIAKRPLGLLALLDDESNFPKATDASFLDKCHYNHALDELYSRPRMSSLEFGVRHYAGHVWYSVEGFLDKNRDTLRPDVVQLLISSKLPMVSQMFEWRRALAEACKTSSKADGRFVTMKPRAPTVAARFHDSLQSLVEAMAQCNPWFVRCIKPNNEKAPMKFDLAVVLEQLRYSGMLDTIRIRKLGYPIRFKFAAFADRYRCLVPPNRLARGASAKDVCRAILDQVPFSDAFQLGTSKVFVREALEQYLEQERVALLRASIVVIQRHVRGYLARRQYTAMRGAALRIQTSYRAYAARRRYRTIRRGVVRAQANFRMLRQKREYDKIKAILARKREADRLALERAKERMARDERASRAVAGVNHLEIPAELAFILSKLDDWPGYPGAVARAPSSAPPGGGAPGVVTPPLVTAPRHLPGDVDQHAFSKFTSIYFKSHVWGMKREPIRTPFLAKSSDTQHQESLALFKLILRFMNDGHLSGRRERVLGDYVVQRALQERPMRDELLCQLSNQTWQNDNEANRQRGWLLMANCLGCFAPSPLLYKYLLKYVSDHGDQDGYAGHCQQQLLRSYGREARTYPPCMLEWQANAKKCRMALPAAFHDGAEPSLAAVDSWTTGEELAAPLVQSRGIDDLFGWTVDLEHGEATSYGLCGADYVLDLISETELPPAFPVCKAYFLVSHDPHSAPPAPETSPHHPGRVNVYEVDPADVTTPPPAPPVRVSSRKTPAGRQREPIPVPPPVVPAAAASVIGPGSRLDGARSRRSAEPQPRAPGTDGSLDRRESRLGGRSIASSSHARSRSMEDLLDEGPADSALSKRSALNGRYFESRADSVATSAAGATSQQRCVATVHHRPDDPVTPSGRSQRDDEDDDDDGGASWGLSASVLNERYFSRSGGGSLIPPSASETASELMLDSPLNGRPGSERSESPQVDARSGTDATRYVKYSGGVGGVHASRRPHSHTAKAQLAGRQAAAAAAAATSSECARSSALSDTSEAPSLASHVRNVRIPSHTSDLDQYLDDLFNPVLLDGGLDELSDARSLAASLRGEDFDDENDDDDDYDLRSLRDPFLLSMALKGDGPSVDAQAAGGALTMGASLGLGSGLVSPLLGFQALQSPSTGPMTAGSTASGSGAQQSAASLYNLPLYNVSGMTVPIVDASQLIQQQVLQQHMMQLQQRAFLANAVQQNLQIQQQLMQQSAALQQLLQSSVVPAASPPPVTGPASSSAGNSGLLARAASRGDPTPHHQQLLGSPLPGLTPLSLSIPALDAAAAAQQRLLAPAAAAPVAARASPRDAFGSVLSELRFKADGGTGAPPPPPPPPPPPLPPMSPTTMAKYRDVYGRAKTVRIGKWRWPPPRDESGNCLPGQPTSFLEFKRLRRQEREERRAAGLQDDSSSDDLDDLEDDLEDDEDLVDFPEIPDMEPNEGGSSPKSSRTRGGGDEEPIIRAFEGETRPGSVGKLRISSEMKAKLEQLTMDHSVRSRASSRRRGDDVDDELPVATSVTPAPSGAGDHRKLREERKLALERQLGWQDAASEAHSFRVDNLVKAKIQKMERRSQLPAREMSSSARPPRATDRAGLGPPPPPPQHQQQLQSFSQQQQQLQHQQQQHFLQQQQQQQQQQPPRGGSGQSGCSSVAASSSVCLPTTPVVPRHREPRHPVALHPEKLLDGMSGSKAEAIEFEDCSEFLQPVDEAPPPAPVVRTRDNLKTRLYPPCSAPYITYTKVEWRLRIRKEVFQPGERLQEPQALHLVFCQVVADAFAPACIRLREDEAARLRGLCDSLGVSPSPEGRSRAPVPAQRSLVDAARELPLYFSRMFPASGGRQLPDVHLVAVAHSGLRLVKRDPPGQLRVLETVRFEDIADVSAARPRTLQLLLRHGGWMTIYSPKAGHIQALVRRFVLEGTQEVPEYVQAVADYVTTESTLLSFREGELIRIIRQRCMGLDKGWLYGVTDTGDSGLFPCEYVAPLSTTRQPVHSAGAVFAAPRDMRSPSEHSHNGGTAWVEAKDHADGLDEQPIEPSNGVESHMADGKHSMLQYAMFNFRESLDRYEMLRDRDGSLRGSLKMLEDIKASKKDSDWTWRELAQLIKFSKSPIKASLLNLESPELNKLAIESFLSVMRYMGDYPMSKNQSEVDCVYSILVSCHKHPPLRDEVYSQIIKQTTSNKSSKPDSCQRGWRLFSIVAAYFDCSENLKPYLFKFLEAAAYDKRRAYHGTAMVCLQNLRKTFKYGGRKNVPSIEEIAAISAGRNSKRQIYRLPGGTERVINTKSTTVVEDIIDEICGILGVRGGTEMDEFSLYCIVEGDPLTMPLSREEYILDVTTELIKNGHVFYLIFCRSVWFFPLRLDNPLYVELIFNQVAPDYLEGLLLVQTQGRRLPDTMLGDIARIAALLHRAADMQHVPSKDEVKYLLPKPVLASKEVKAPHWVDLVQRNWADMMALNNTEAKAQCLDILQRWPLFGSCFFAVKWIRNESSTSEHILALNRDGIHFLDVVTHESVWMYPFSEVISTRKVRAEDGTLFLDMKCGNLMVQKITRIQTDQAHEISRLVRQYINIQQSHQGNVHGGAPQDVTLSRNLK